MDFDDVTIAILVGGNSTRFGSEKSLALFKGKPLVTHMISKATSLSTNLLVVVSNDIQQKVLGEVIGDVDIATDIDDADQSALNGAVSAFEHSDTEYTMLLPVDTPLANEDLLRTILELRSGHGAVVPAWPNGYVEPLHSVYLTEHAYDKGLDVIESGKRRMQDLLDSLTNVLYIQTEILRMFDKHLQTFANVNTPNDLMRLEEEVIR